MRLLPIVLVLLCSASSRAADVALNVAAFEVVTLPSPAHGGFYPSVAVSLGFPLGPVVLVPSLALEWSFDQGRGGLVLGTAADFPLNERLGFDLAVFLVHDQPGLRIRESAFSFGAATGVSFYLGKWTLSPSIGVYAGLNVPGVSIAPALNLAWTLT